MISSDGLDLPGWWNEKLGAPESPGSLFTCVAPLTIILLTAEGRRRQRNRFSAMAGKGGFSDGGTGTFIGQVPAPGYGARQAINIPYQQQ
jgi:hypothetical protein